MLNDINDYAWCEVGTNERNLSIGMEKLYPFEKKFMDDW